MPNTIIGYSQQAAQEYLQTVVFIDDRIFERHDDPVVEPKKVASPKRRKLSSKTAQQTAPEPIQPEKLEEDEYSPHDVLKSFAKKQIICSLYQPPKRAKVSQTSDIFLLCHSADIVIVDWDLYGDRGERALELIEGLIQQAVKDVPEQLRLILVYTQEVNLFNVADELYQKVNKSVGHELIPVKEDNGLAFHTLNSRVSIFGKSGSSRPEEYEPHVVEEKKLADIAINEFAKLANGLLHAVTLRGLAEIKKNSRKILSKFNATLDPAFLTHMAMSLPEAEASTHIIPLIVSEIESVLQDALPKPLISEGIIKDWCQNVWQPGEHLGGILGNDGTGARAIGEAICLKGFQKAKEKFNSIPKLSTNKNIRNAASILLSKNDDKSNHLFSHLMASRTFYGKMPKALKLGSILYDKLDDRYFLCIQPVCDCVRLDRDRVFMFVQLMKTDPDSDNRTSHIVAKNEKESIELFYQAKSYQCYTAKFKPDSQAKQVLSKNSGNGESVFVDKSNKQYIWVDQLKTAHAQRAVENLASDLSRVGLTESEWLRLLTTKK